MYLESKAIPKGEGRPANSFAAMFHHFHDGYRHPRSQGSISADQFCDLLQSLQTGHHLLSADDYLERSLAGELGPEDICLTFDDALLSQFEVALPVLDGLGLKAFFFVYTSIFTDQPDKLEVYRDFRSISFDDIDAFYRDFFALFERRHPGLHGSYLARYPNDYLSAFPFYSEGDRRFRFVRDQLLEPARYDELMHELMAEADYPLAERRDLLWMKPSHVADLTTRGHEVGLHSHTHPLRMERLAPEVQAREYAMNQRMLTEICGRPPRSMSHPCGSYNAATLEILGGMDIQIGFRSNPDCPPGASVLELPREDHAILIEGMS